MKKLLMLFVGLVAFANSAQAAWKFDGVWNGHAFTAYEWNQDQAQLRWSDGAAGFTGFYTIPNPAPRCPCSVYLTNDNRNFTVEHGMRGIPSGGWYRGVPFRVVGQPQQF